MVNAIAIMTRSQINQLCPEGFGLPERHTSKRQNRLSGVKEKRRLSGLLSTQFGVLQVMYNIDSVRISDLADKLGMDRTTLTRNLSVLERDGSIKISQGKDHRTRIVAATQKGRSAVDKATPLWNEAQRKVKQKMGESSWHELMQNLGGFLKVTDQLTNQSDRHQTDIRSSSSLTS